MKSLTIVVHTDDQQDLTNQLREIDQVQGFTISHIEGHGIEPEQDAFLSARDDVVGSSPRVRADIVLQDSDVDTVLDALRDVVGTGNMKGAHYWVTAVEQEGHL
jgi:nitrogen regulatory protein P-II 1